MADRLFSYFTTPYVRPDIRQIMIAGLGGALAIGLVGLLAHLSGSALLMAPLGATAVLVFGLADSPLSGPRHVMGGHALSMSIGLLCLFIVSVVTPGFNILPFILVSILAAGIGTGLAIAVMLATRTVHPPAGANPILLMFSGAGFTDAALLIALPGVAGAFLLYLVAVFLRRANAPSNR
ncbi:HPP family protein [Parvibaculaceae bacterium PLY_AMNH_Bact1]|nr:HPP family protein [Parvibaculaceae bacterium PLY_AMNH_Bact1]